MATKKATRKSVAKQRPAQKKSIGKAAKKKSAAKRVSLRDELANAAPPPLAIYNAKRDFSRTKEPSGKVPAKRGKALAFVIQKHEASHLHFDFRLELDGVMKSWAVPKGPSLDPAVKRLAMEVEDHPISYNAFEGTIPQGEYGGGTVMLWDRGTYEPEDGGGVESLREGYRRGDLKIALHGKRLEGSWVLVRMKRPGRPQWLLIKHSDEHADPARDIVAEVKTSVASRRTMASIAKTGTVRDVYYLARPDQSAIALVQPGEACILLNSRGIYSMPNTLRLTITSLALATIAACSRSADQPALSDDLKKDLASVGGGDVQLAGMATPRLDVVSVGERTKSLTPAPKSPTVSRAPSAFHGTRAPVKSVKHDTPAAAQAEIKAAEVAPAEVPQVQRAPEPTPAAQGRPEAPRPSTQREPRGGWKTPGQIIRNAPFPINP